MCGGIHALGRAVGDLYEPFYNIPSSLKLGALGCCYYYSSRQNTLELAAIFTIGTLFFKCCSQSRPKQKAQPLPPSISAKRNQSHTEAENPNLYIKRPEKGSSSEPTSSDDDMKDRTSVESNEGASSSDSDYVPSGGDSDADDVYESDPE